VIYPSFGSICKVKRVPFVYVKSKGYYSPFHKTPYSERKEGIVSRVVIESGGSVLNENTGQYDGVVMLTPFSYKIL